VPFSQSRICMSSSRVAWRLLLLVPNRAIVIAALAALPVSAAAQESSSKKTIDSSSSENAHANSKQKDTEPARRIPDALTFANGLLRQRKYDLAAEEYQRYLNSNPTGLDRDDARFGLGNARLFQGRYDEARHAFDEFLKAAPDGPRSLTARYRLGELSYLLGDLPAARRALETFTGGNTAHPALETAWTYLGDTCYGLEDYPRARAAYERSISAYPQGRLVDRASYGLGRTLAELGERERAVQVLEELAKKNHPEWVDRAWLQIGLIRKSDGKYVEAIDALTNLERAAPRSGLRPQARLERGLALARLERAGEAELLLRALANDTSEPLGARAALELATIELEQDHAGEALTTIEQAINRFPKSPLIPALEFRSAEALLKQNHPAEAQARFLRVAELTPNDPWADDAVQRAAQTALDRADAATAGRLAASFATKYPRSPLRNEVRLIEARAASMAGKPRDAAAILESILKASPEAAKDPAPPLAPPLGVAARYDLALAYRALGRSAEADALLAKLASESAGPVTADAKFLLGQGHLDAGRYTEAIPALEQYVAANPQGDVADFALAHLAMARLGLGQLNEAWKTLGTLSDRFPRSKALPATRLRLAEAALAAHQADRAAEQFRLVARPAPAVNAAAPLDAGTPGDATDPSLRVRARFGLGKALWELGKPADAATEFAAALELTPTGPLVPELLLARGRALEASQQGDAALKAYSSVAERFPKSEQAPLARLAHARLLGKSGQHGAAAREFQRLIDDASARDQLKAAGTTLDALYAEWGWSLVDAGEPAESDRVFTRLLKDFPESSFAADARFNLAESANLAHNFAEVVRLLDPLVAISKPDSKKTGGPSTTGPTAVPITKHPDLKADSLRRLLPAVLYRLGRSCVELRDWSAARAALDRLAHEFPDSPYRREAIYLRAEAALQGGDAAAALDGFAAILKEPPASSDPKSWIPAVRLKQIQCWVALKQWKLALEAAKELTAALAPDDPIVAELDFASGQGLLGLARLEEARAAFQRVIDRHGKTELAAQALLMHGEAYFHQDQFHEALRDFLKVDILYNAPRWQAAALLEAGKVYERLDQWADAAETYGRLLTRFPNEPIAEDARLRRAAANGRAASTP
jgi:cellulose synthase operon protein C